MTLEPIGLEGIERVSLQKRFDLKFIFSNENFGTVFSLLKNDFFVLEVENKRIQKYLNYYFDTDFYQFYLSHHNGKLNRTKLRKRCYVESELAFLEHKFKSNKGKTIKKRLRIDMMSKSISDEEQQFLRDNEIVDPLKNVLESEFLRVTFVSKDYSSRITLDMNLEYRNEMQTFRFPKLSVLEIKSSDPNLGSKMFKGNSEIFQTGFSKYCFGMIYLYPQLKNNNFKPLFLRLKKMGVI